MTIIEGADIPEVLREAADRWQFSTVDGMYCATWREPFKCGCEAFVVASTAEELAEKMRLAETVPGQYQLAWPRGVKSHEQHSR